MAKVFDILIDWLTGDLAIRNGDFVIGESTKQHQNHLLIANKGELINNETSGVGLKNYLSDDEVDGAELKSVIQEEFEADGMSINKLRLNGIVESEIDAEYEDD